MPLTENVSAFHFVLNNFLDASNKCIYIYVYFEIRCACHKPRTTGGIRILMATILHSVKTVTNVKPFQLIAVTRVNITSLLLTVQPAAADLSVTTTRSLDDISVCFFLLLLAA